MKTRTSNSTNIEEWKLEFVLASLLELSDSQGRLICPPFRVLESKEEFPLYYEQIKNPIDLRTIAERIRNEAYTSWNSFESDIKLLIKNAKQFNESSSIIYKDASKIALHLNEIRDEIQQNNFKLTDAEIEHSKDLITNLLESTSSEQNNLSEDSEEDEDTETNSDSKWVLYWKIRNFDVIDGFPLCTHFLELPSRKCYPDYYEEIEKPISLYMINKMLKRDEIRDLKALVGLLQQMFKNARLYNVEESEIYEAANTLERLTVDTAKELQPNIALKLDERVPNDIDEQKATTSRSEKPEKLVRKSKRGRRPRKRMRKMSEDFSDGSVEDEVAVQIKREEIAEYFQSQENDKDDEDEEGSNQLAPKRRIGRPPRRLDDRVDIAEKVKPGRKSLEELRDKYTETLMKVWTVAKEVGSRGLSDAFMVLPDPKEYPDYYKIIKNPIDLMKIRKKIENGEYQDSDEFLADFILMCENAQKYNRPNSQIAMDAKFIETAAKAAMMSATNEKTIYYPYRKTDKNWTENAACSGRALGKPRRSKVPKLEAFSTNTSDNVSTSPFFVMTSQGMLPCGPPGMVPYYPPGAPAGSLPIFIPKNMEMSNSSTAVVDNTIMNIPDTIALPTDVPPPNIEYVDRKEASDEGSVRKGRPKRSPCSEEDQMNLILESIIAYADTSGRRLSDIFMKLPSRAEYPAYYEVIKKPMDLNRIRIKVHQGKYDSMKSFITDMNLVFDNACKFNEPDSRIYKDSLILQKNVLLLRNQFDEEKFEFPSVQCEVRSILKELLLAVTTEKDCEEKCLSDKLMGVHEILRKAGAKPEEFPLTLDEIKVNVDKGRYRRLDRFQDDIFFLFSKIREYNKTDSQMYMISVELQQFYIKKRDELCKNVLKSPAMLYNHSMLNDELETLEKRRRQRTRQKAINEADVETESTNDNIQISQKLENVSNEIHLESINVDDVMKEHSGILDVHRAEVPEYKRSTIGGAGDTTSDTDIVYYQQIEHAGKYYQLGDGVLVFREGKSHCEVMRIDKMWKNTEDEKFFSGVVFLRPKEIAYEPSTMFHPREVFAVEQFDVTESFKNVQAKCAVLTAKQFETCRPTEIPECDVYVVDYKVVGNIEEIPYLNNKNCALITSTNIEDRHIPEDGALNLRYARNNRKLKTYKLSTDVIEDEVFYFKTPITMEKTLSPRMMTADSALSVDHSDLDTEADHLDDTLDSQSGLKDSSWLASQPKLNSKSKSGYILFSAEVRKRIMNENPEAGFGEVSKIVGIEWKKLDSEAKRQYELRAQYIAEERAKAEPSTPSCKPGQVCVYVCRWERCDFHFNSQEGLSEHIRTSHAINIAQEFMSAQRSSNRIDNFNSDSKTDKQYVCMWYGCNKFRRDGKPFPTLPRLLRHVKEKHLNTAGRAIDAEQRPKNYFVYYTSEQLQSITTTPSTSGKNDPGRFVHHPYGIQPQNAIACIVATPTLSSRTNSPVGIQQPQHQSSYDTSTTPNANAALQNYQYCGSASTSSSYRAETPTVGNVAGAMPGGNRTNSYLTAGGSYFAGSTNAVLANGEQYNNGTSSTVGAQASLMNGYSANGTTHYVIQPSSSATTTQQTVASSTAISIASGTVQYITASGHYATAQATAPPQASSAAPIAQTATPQMQIIYQHHAGALQQQPAAQPTAGIQYVQTTINGTTVYVPAGAQYQAYVVNPNGTVSAAGQSQHPPQPQTHQIVIHQPASSSSAYVVQTPQQPQQPQAQVYAGSYSAQAVNIPQGAAYITNGASGVAYQLGAHANTATNVQPYTASTSSQQSQLVHAQTGASHPQINGTSHSAMYASQGVSVSQQPNQLNASIDAGRTLVQASQTASTSARSMAEPVFVAPSTSSVQVKRVLHSEAYVKYIESLYSTKQQKTISKWDKSLLSNHRNTATNHKKLPYEWVKKILPATSAATLTTTSAAINNGDAPTPAQANGTSSSQPHISARAAKAAAREAKAREKEMSSAANGISNGNMSKEEQEMIRPLWRLRDQLIENTTGIQRATAAATDH